MTTYNKTITAVILLFAMAVGVCAVASNRANNNVTPQAESEEYLEDNHAWPGMFFTSEAVIDEYEYDDAYCLLYDDADANMFNVEILVDLETYQLVTNVISEKRELIGTLVLNDDLSTEDAEIFTYLPDPEFEMAAASASL